MVMTTGDLNTLKTTSILNEVNDMSHTVLLCLY